MTVEDRRLTSPQSVTRVIRILEALCASDDPVSLADLSRLLGTPKSSMAALLRGLADEDLVLAVDGGYRLGPGAYGLGSAILGARQRLHSSDLVREGMRRLAERSGETVLFAVRDAGGETMTYVDAIESRNTIRFAVAAGDRRPLYCTAGGRMLLAAGSEAARATYIAEHMTDKPEVARRLAEALAVAQRTGSAQTVDEMAEGVTGTASAIRDMAGTVIGVLVVAAPSSRSKDRLADLATLVRDEAKAVSRVLGYRGE